MSGGSDAADAPSPAPAEAAAAAAAGRAARFAAPAAPLTEYELEREAQIKRNSAKLAALNLPKLAPPASPRATKRKAKAAAAERTEPPRRSGRVPSTKRASLADASDDDSFGKGGGFIDTEDEKDDASGGSDSDGPRRKKAKRKPITLDGFPALRAGAGVVPGAVQSRSCEAGAGAPAAGAPAAAPIQVPATAPAGASGHQPKGYVRQADGLQARFGHVLQAGAPSLHAHELAELRYILTQPPYYSPVKLAELLDGARAWARERKPSEAKQYVTGKFVAAHFKVSKLVANAVVAFLSRARVINAAPALEEMRARAGNDRLLSAAGQAAEAAIAAGTLRRPVVSASEATALPPNVFVTTGRSSRLVHNNVGYKGVRRGCKAGEFLAELFDGPTRYRLGTFATAVEAAEAYDRAVIRVRAVTAASQLNFPLERYANANAEAKAEGKAAPAAAAQAEGTMQPAPARPEEDPLAPPVVTLAEAAGVCT